MFHSRSLSELAICIHFAGHNFDLKLKPNWISPIVYIIFKNMNLRKSILFLFRMNEGLVIIPSALTLSFHGYIERPITLSIFIYFFHKSFFLSFWNISKKTVKN